MINPTVTLFVTKRCNLSQRCENCPAKCGDASGMELVQELDADRAVAWLDRFFPGCPVHISGGEPLMYSELEYLTRLLIDRHHDVTIFTNATLFEDNDPLYDLDVKWHLTHHAESGVSFDLFSKNIQPLVSKKHVVARLYHGRDALNRKSEVESLYCGFNFKWISLFSGYENYAMLTPPPSCPNERTLLVGLFGEVFNCSTPAHGQCGNIYDNTFDIEMAMAYRCHRRDYPHGCQPLQTEEIMRLL